MLTILEIPEVTLDILWSFLGGVGPKVNVDPPKCWLQSYKHEQDIRL